MINSINQITSIDRLADNCTHEVKELMEVEGQELSDLEVDMLNDLLTQFIKTKVAQTEMDAK